MFPLARTFVIAVAMMIAARPACATDSSNAGDDGPYVFHREDGSLEESRIVGQGPEAKVVTRSMSADGATIEVAVPGARSRLEVGLRVLDAEPPCELPEAKEVFAVSDIEGECEAFVAMLVAGGVIDLDLNWTFGDGRLVVVGDVFDRGLHVTECLWLCYALEARARDAGGGAHFLLGNHEVMNLEGDVRYVRKKYQANAALLGRSQRDLYSTQSVLGRWLRTRNAAIRIGRDLYVHGGVSPQAASIVARDGMRALNDELRAALLAGSLPEIASPRLSSVVDSTYGWIWYRGYFKDPRATSGEVDAALAAHDVDRIVVGHTLVDRVGFHYDGRVLAIDVRHASGAGEGALLRDGSWHRVSRTGEIEPIEKDRRG